MLKAGDEEWLGRTHPGLALADGAVRGTIEFTASYDAEHDLFQAVDDNGPTVAGGVVLAGEFMIRIEERTAKVFSELPALFVEKVEPIPNRHFGADKSACMCSSLEEDEFLTPEFQFQPFVEKLVIPFLFGQLFYTLNHRWPWQEYAHYATGLFESYGRCPDPAKAEAFLQTLTKFPDSWPAVRAALQQKAYIKGHTPCFCSKKDQIRRCHPRALRGIQQLHADIRALHISVP
jgi:hypothetical protein